MTLAVRASRIRGFHRFWSAGTGHRRKDSRLVQHCQRSPEAGFVTDSLIAIYWGTYARPYCRHRPPLRLRLMTIWPLLFCGRVAV